MSDAGLATASAFMRPGGYIVGTRQSTRRTFSSRCLQPRKRAPKKTAPFPAKQ